MKKEVVAMLLAGGQGSRLYALTSLAGVFTSLAGAAVFLAADFFSVFSALGLRTGFFRVQRKTGRLLAGLPVAVCRRQQRQYRGLPALGPEGTAPDCAVQLLPRVRGLSPGILPKKDPFMWTTSSWLRGRI